jgi:ribosomal protein S18 acetylase RimI-like enzyme
VAGAKIRRLTERDIDAAIALTDLEGWGYSRADFDRLLYLSPRGCFVAERQGAVVGVLTTTPYGRLAFLGAVIVKPDLRGQAIGRAMIEVALGHLKKSGIETVRLYAYLNQIRFYAGLGFRGEHRVVRWTSKGSVEPSPASVRPVRPDELDRIAKFDRSYFGADREKLLRRVYRESPDTFLVTEVAGRLRGYAVGMRTGDSCEIGPWMVDPRARETPLSLLGAIASAAASTTYSFSGPVVNARISRFAHAHGFQPVFRTLQMVWGRQAHLGRPEGVWGVGGLEKG